MQIDYWGLFWESVGSFLDTIARSFGQNPWLGVAIIALIAIGLLAPAQRRRRRR
jgi:hypothetical protein